MRPPKSRAEHGSRQKGNEHADDEASCSDIALEHIERDSPQLAEIDRENGKDRAELNEDREALPETDFIKAEDAFYEKEMARGGDRQELGSALDNTENYRP